MGYGVLATVLRTRRARVALAFAHGTPLWRPTGCARGLRDRWSRPAAMLRSSGPAPTPAPAPLVPFALPECTRCNLNFAIRVIFGQYEADLGEG